MAHPQANDIHVAADGRVWLGPTAQPSRDPTSWITFLSPGWRLETTSKLNKTSILEQVYDPTTGALSPIGADERWGIEAHIQCGFIGTRSLRCVSSDMHAPAIDFTYDVTAEGQVTGTVETTTVPIARISPRPSDEQAGQALFLLAAFAFDGDNHGDDAHDLPH